MCSCRLMRHAGIGIASALTIWLAMDVGAARITATDAQPRRMSFHNRLLLNRVVISGLDRLEVMLLAHDQGLAPTTALVQRLGGRVRRTVTAVGYLRVEVPTDKLLSLVASTGIDAYQISSLSQASVYRDGTAEKEAEMWRRFETTSSIPIPAPLPTKDTPATTEKLPPLSVERSRESGYTGEDDVGLGEWMKAHPTFDGRGVTVAIVESALPEFTHPTIGHAKSLDGRDIPKLAGILNTIPADDPDETRLELDHDVHAVTAWCKVDGRTYIVPHPGHYRLGVYTMRAGSNLAARFGVLEDEATHDIRVDTNGDADFRDETPIGDVNEKMDVRALKVMYLRPTELSFVLARGRTPHTVNIYTSIASHQAMTLSAVAGSKTDDSLAFGVAPAARVLLVDNRTTAFAAHNLFEGFLEAAARPDVDILTCSEGFNSVPDTAADFVGLFFSRMTAVYRKPIFVGAGNDQLWPASVSAFGDAFSVGGSLGPATFAAFEGGATLPGLMVHHTGAAGPSIDGRLKPDFLAPVERVTATLWTSKSVPIPKNAPRVQLPPGYEVSCCTSSSTPYAAGIAAVLLSASKQAHLPYSLEQLARALRVGAHFLPDAPSFEQGNGVLDVNAAWRELHNSVDIPTIHTTAPIVSPLAAYAAHGNEGEGIFEEGGWSAGMTGTRELQFRRESGPATPITYRVDWTGNDGTFSAPEQVVLPLNTDVHLPVAIAIRSNGARSAILNLHDPATDAIVFRTQATIFAPDVIDPRTHAVRLTGSVPLMQQDSRFVTVPDHVSAMSIELEVLHGSLMVSLLPGNGLLPLYSPLSRVYPEVGRTFTAGRYRVVLPYPVAGTWGIDLDNASARRERDQTLVRTETAEYAVTITMLNTTLRPQWSDGSAFSVEVANTGGTLGESVLESSPATRITRTGRTLPNGVPRVFDVDVPAGSATLVVQVHSQETDGIPLELYLYDCTSGECFNLDFTLPAAHEQMIVVRKPKAGRWRAAVNTGPFPGRVGGFVIDTIVATGAAHRSVAPAQMRARGERWTENTERMSSSNTAANGVLYELVDLAAQRDCIEHKWENRKDYPDMSDLPASVGMLFQPFEHASHK